MRRFEEKSEAIEVDRDQATQACVPGLGHLSLPVDSEDPLVLSKDMM